MGEERSLKLVKRKLKIITTELTAMSTFSSHFNASTDDINEVRVRLESLLDTVDRFESHQTELEDLEDEVPDNLRIAERMAFKDLFFSVKSSLMKLVNANQENRSTSPSYSEVTKYNGENAMRLPPINAPKFTGDWQMWTSFIDSFNAMFHNNKTLAPVQRLHYLKSCLEGQASDVIRSIPTTGENYLQAYNTLVNRYENKGAIIQSHIRSLLETPKVHTASATDLQRLHHHIMSNINALRALEQPVHSWDAWLVTLICNRMDSSTVGEWQLHYNSKELASFTAIESFLFNRIAAYEAGDMNDCKSASKPVPVKPPRVNEKKVFFTKHSENKAKCIICNTEHFLFQCMKFKNLSIKERRETVFNNRLCFNCLKADHQARQCKSSSCTRCNKRHNTLLHLDHEESVRDTLGNHESQSVQDSDSVPPNVVACGIVDRTLQIQSNVQIILATAVVHVCDAAGNMRQCRAVLDSGSQLCFITNKMARRLGLHIINNTVPISGIGQSKSATSKCCVGTVHSRINQTKFQLQFHVLPTITGDLPTQTFNSNQFKIPDNVQTALADPNFNKSGTVDILLGAEIFFDILKQNKHRVSTHTAFQDTAFGWILIGKVNTPTSMCSGVHPGTTCQVSALSLVTSTVLSRQCEEEEIVEQHFTQTTTRNDKGQFIVRLPLKDHPSCIGNTSGIAKKRFLNLENKLVKNSALANEYDEFLMEYLKLGHMEQGGQYYDDQAKGYYIPHHAVFKSNSITTKTRVVFDASATGSSGKSLNDILMKGPVVQPTLYSTLLRFRIHQIALTADIEKMYRQILVHSDDCQLQKIVYRSKPTDKLQEFILKTVTYGTKTAPYLATRCLVQLGKTCNDSEISQIIQRDFYVDDLLTGADTVEECHNIYQKLTNILTSAQLPLRKWCSNSPILLSWLPTTTDANYLLPLSESESVSTLGLMWQPSSDSFCYSVKPWSPPKWMTKRSLLSDINSIYDPLGLVTPVMIKGKIFVQQLWYLKVNWDDKLSEDLCSKWKRFYLNLQQLDKLTVPRKVIRSDSVGIQIHGFCDASQLAFGTCVYLRTVARDGSVSVHLYTSKSRVAPMKATTIPRLELCGAVLLADLINEVQMELSQLGITIPSDNIFLWSDSTIVLAWITSQCIFHVYVANRIARIQDLTKTNQWHHVPTNANPAELISRGVEVQVLSESALWWHGPPWLSQEPTSWPNCPILPTEIPETRPVKLVLSTQQAANELMSRYSNWSRLIRVTGWIMRFCNNAKIRKHQQDLRSTHHLSVLELKTARMIWVRQAQRQSFQRDIDILSQGNQLSGSSKLRSLHPFLDSDGLIRVGGRLSNSTHSNSRKYPIVLPSDHLITKLIFKSEHERLLHIGPQGLLANIHIQYWPLRGRILARSTVHKCIICFRASPVTSAPIMAPLPRERVTVARPFTHTGVDFCGPISIRSGIRRVSAVKGYIAVFVCFVTRAIHLEVVSNLSTEAFLAALERFIARRGICGHIYSDQGTNFVGAHKVLQMWFKTSTDKLTIQERAATKGIEWHFNPPSSPHLGGLWEAAVKSAKKHLSKICHSALLTFEETVTLLCRIEAILNSRPLTPLSNDPSDFNALTPAHFLVGESLVFPPEPEILTSHVNHIKRWSLVKGMYQNFWKRWLLEYLPQLQRRNKWFNPGKKVAVGDLALLKEDNMAVMKWKLVRVEAIHPGPDGTVRVVTVRNPNGTLLKRPMVKIAVLPTSQESTI